MEVRGSKEPSLFEDVKNSGFFHALVDDLMLLYILVELSYQKEGIKEKKKGDEIKRDPVWDKYGGEIGENMSEFVISYCLCLSLFLTPCYLVFISDNVFLGENYKIQTRMKTLPTISPGVQIYGLPDN